MKRTKLIFTIFSILLLNLAVFAGEDASAQDKTEISQTITSFVKSVDARNTTDLSRTVLLNGSIVVFNKISNSMNNLTTNQLIDMVKSGQKGGWTRNVTVNSVDVNGNTAVARVDITDARLKESGFLTLVKQDGAWKVASEVATLELNK